MKRKTDLHRVILEVPYSEKDEAKELGAWWDPDIRKWFVPRGKDPEPFSKWFAGPIQQELGRGNSR